MNFIISFIKRLSLRCGFTILRGNLRDSIKAQPDAAPLPDSLLTNARVASSRYQVLSRLPRGGVAVEVGVGYGDFTIEILRDLQPRQFIAIDTFGIPAHDEPWGRTQLKDSGLSHLGFYQDRFKDAIHSGTMELMQGLSWEMIAALPDESVDFMYVDADHSFESVSRDSQALHSKIRPGGIVQFNDYTFFDQYALMPYGVPAVVHALMIQHGYEMLYLCLHPQGYYDVVLRKMES